MENFVVILLLAIHIAKDTKYMASCTYTIFEEGSATWILPTVRNNVPLCLSSNQKRANA